MGYLQNIKSPEMYVKMMRAFLFRMPTSERTEVCQEVHQHLAALVEDHQAEGYSPQEAIALAIQQFGPPFKVGGEIARKWEAKTQRLLEATQPRLARRKKRLVFLTAAFSGSMPVLISMNYHYWLVIVVLASAHGLLSGVLYHYTQRLGVWIAGPKGPPEERDWPETRELWEEKLPQITEQIRHGAVGKSAWGRLNLLAAQWVGKRVLETAQGTADAPAAFKRRLFWQVLGLAYLAVLVLWPAEGQFMTMRNLLIFLFVSVKMSSLSRRLADKRWPAVKTAQM